MGQDPAAIAYVGLVGELFVANARSNNLTVVNDTFGNVIGSISVGVDPTALLWSGAYLYVADSANGGSGTVHVWLLAKFTDGPSRPCDSARIMLTLRLQ